MFNKYFSHREFLETAEYNKFPAHDDISGFLNNFAGKEPRNDKRCFETTDNTKVIEHYACLVDNLDDLQDDDIANFDIGYILAMIGHRLQFQEDYIGDDVVHLRLVPFAYLFAGDFLCFYFETETSRPKIVVWHHEESDEFSPVFEIVADHIDEFLKEKLIPLDEEA
jgi:hypothetical protein